MRRSNICFFFMYYHTHAYTNLIVIRLKSIFKSQKKSVLTDPSIIEAKEQYQNLNIL